MAVELYGGGPIKVKRATNKAFGKIEGHCQVAIFALHY